MQFVVHALDQIDAGPRRAAAIAAHRDYLSTAPEQHEVTVLLSGPLVSDDEQQMIGSFFLLDAPDRGAVDALFADDPLRCANVWSDYTVTTVRIRQNNMTSTQGMSE